MMQSSSAVISDCGRYRYELRRGWQDLLSYDPKWTVLWLMLNPSTADAEKDDPTIRKCIAFSKSWGYSGLVVANAYACRSPYPGTLKRVLDPIGPDNDATLVRLISQSGITVVGWGKGCDPRRAKEVAGLAAKAGPQLLCLGVNSDGSPKHPLYLKGDTKLVPWAPAVERDRAEDLR